MRDCPQNSAATVSGRLFLDLTDPLTSPRDALFWAMQDVPDGTEVIVRVGRTLNLNGCYFPEVDVVPRVRIVVEGPDAETVRTAVNAFRTALAQWVQRTDAERAERQEREAQEAADRAWFANRRAAVNAG